MIKAFLRSWDYWWCRDAPPHALAVFRIALGVYFLIQALYYMPHIVLLVANDGVPHPLFLERAPEAFKIFLTPPPPIVVSTLFIIAICFILMFIVGYKTHLSAFAILLLTLYAWQINLHLFPTSYNRLTMLALLILGLSGCHKTLSVDMWKKHGSFLAWEPASVLPQRLIAVQITFTYFAVGFQKLILPSWKSGEVLSYALIGQWATRPAYWFIQLNFPIQFWDFIVFVTKVMECLIPFGLWIPAVRKWFMLFGLVFHGLIGILLTIWQFLVLIPAYILFLEPEEAEKLITKIISSFAGDNARKVVE